MSGRRIQAAVMAGAALAVAGALGASATAPAARTGQVVRGPQRAAPGSRLWVARYSRHVLTSEFSPAAVATAPDGRRVYVAGTADGKQSHSDYVTIAYSHAGRQLWARQYNSPGNGYEEVRSMAISPDGATVFVTGGSNTTAGTDYATVAYRASDGRQLWVSRYQSPGAADYARAVSVARNGKAVFVTGESSNHAADAISYATVAYRASDGKQLWASRYGGPRSRVVPLAVVSPGANRVIVTGSSTVAYNAATGAQLWARRYPGDTAVAAASAGGTTVYVTGSSTAKDRSVQALTVAYRASDGRQQWARRYGGRRKAADVAVAIAAGPGGAVFVTGTTWPGAGHRPSTDYLTLAYDSAGRQRWVRTYNGPVNGADMASSVAASAGGKVYVTGTSYGGRYKTIWDYATIAYDADSGSRQWVRRFSSPGASSDSAKSAAARAGKLYVTGGSATRGEAPAFVTIAYQG